MEKELGKGRIRIKTNLKKKELASRSRGVQKHTFQRGTGGRRHLLSLRWLKLDGNEAKVEIVEAMSCNQSSR